MESDSSECLFPQAECSPTFDRDLVLPCPRVGEQVDLHGNLSDRVVHAEVLCDEAEFSFNGGSTNRGNIPKSSNCLLR